MKKHPKGDLRRSRTCHSLGITVKATVAVLASLLLAHPSLSDNDVPRLFRIGTGGRTGVYFPIGTIIAQGITPDVSGKESTGGVPGYIGVAQSSAGSIDNALGVASGDIEAGLVQADVAAWAFKGEHAFKGKERSRMIRAVASLYPEKFQIVTRRDANIRSVNDLRGKRISLDEVGSGTLAVMRIVLEAHGMSEKDMLPVYLKPVFIRDKVVSGELQGFVIMAGAPVAAVSGLADVGISLVPIPAELAARINAQYPYLVPGLIPAGAYPGIQETPTLEVHALLVVSAEMEADLAYKITAALWSQRTLSMLRSGNPQGKSIVPEKALAGLSIPLHPGAERYYRERFSRFENVPSK